MYHIEKINNMIFVLYNKIKYYLDFELVMIR